MRVILAYIKCYLYLLFVGMWRNEEMITLYSTLYSDHGAKPRIVTIAAAVRGAFITKTFYSA